MNIFKKKVNPTISVGVPATPIYGGYVDTGEKNPSVASQSQRNITSADIITNISVVAASVRYFLNLVSNPSWNVIPVDDSDAAKEAAEFIEESMEHVNVSWTRLIRRMANYRYHGYSISEWTAQKNKKGKLFFKRIDQRPASTIERWERDESGSITGVWQRDNQTGREIFIERWKLIYLVDDALTDSPEGLGWFRHIVEPAERLKKYLVLEKVGFERDLAGIPVGRAPITAINRAVKAGSISQQQASSMISGLKDFVKLESKKENTGLLLDSQTFENQTSDGVQATGTAQWSMDLLTSDAGSIAELGAAIDRISVEIARIIGTENIFTGSGSTGSFALSKDKSNNLYLNVNSTLIEMAEQFNKDYIKPLWDLNGFDPELMPKFKTEEVSFKDAESISTVLSNMASAGAVLSPNDPAINDLRMLLGISDQEEVLPID